MRSLLECRCAITEHFDFRVNDPYAIPSCLCVKRLIGVFSVSNQSSEPALASGILPAGRDSSLGRFISTLASIWKTRQR